MRTMAARSQPQNWRKWGMRHRVAQNCIDYGKQVGRDNHVASINIDGTIGSGADLAC